MLKTLVEKIWTRIPYKLRGRLIRATQKKFTVSVAAIVTNEKDEVLVLDHFFRPRYSWGLPGGFLNPYEAPEDGICRELFEEASVKLENVKFISAQTIGTHIEIIFVATSTGEAKVSSGEIRDLGWFPLDALPEMGEGQILLLKKVLNKS